MKAPEKQILDCDSLLKAKSISFQKCLKEFKRLVKTWRDHEIDTKMDNSSQAIMVQYAHYIEQAHNICALDNSFQLKNITCKDDLKNIKHQMHVFLGFVFLYQKQWRLNFNKTFIFKLARLEQKLILQIFFLLSMLVEGYFTFSEGKFNSLDPFQRISKFDIRYYTRSIEIQREIFYLLFTIGVHKLPSYGLSGLIDSFSYSYVVTCQDFIHNFIFCNQKKMNSIIDLLEANYEQDLKVNYQKHQLVTNYQSMDRKFIYYQSKQSRRKSKQAVKLHPPIYKRKYISKHVKQSQDQMEEFQFKLEKYMAYRIRSQYLSQTQGNSNQLKLSDDKQSIQSLQLQVEKNKKMEFKSHSKHLQILQKIPNFKYALTNQQREVICSNGNLIVVGRSGTGKTTCAMLRLYGIQFSIKMKQFNSLKKQQKIFETSQKCSMVLLDEIQLSKNIFLTFSSVLIDQIKKQYNDMIYQIKEKHSKKCKICEKSILNFTSSAQNQDPIDKLRRINQEQDKKVVALNSIQAEDFPGFFTIQNFIRIIDKSIQRPFFVQQKQKMETNNNIEIKYSKINKYEYTESQIIIKNPIKAVYIDFNFFLYHIWQKLPKQLTKSSKQFCLLTPSVVWSEIFSILKGSINAYLCPKGYISLRMYLENTQSIFQTEQSKRQEYKKKTYKIMKSYIEWCKCENAYDLTDVVNHNLREIQFYGYSGPKINYMFIDEVQDLTASTTLLISKMVINNIFYCGDTAQAITKGVSFRFQDLKLLFNQRYFKNALSLQSPGGIQNLTVNFRSHNSIIQLANSIISSIQILFPQSINRLKKQKSDLIGPKPFLIINQNQQTIFQLICTPTLQEQHKEDLDLRQMISKSELQKNANNSNKLNKKKRKNKKKHAEEEQDLQQEVKERRQFNNEQIVIVRNIQQKQNLPQSLTKGIVLTPQTAKGLEFDEIILYNFFSSCPIYEKWNTLLQHLDSIQTYQDQRQFQKQLTRRSEEQKNIQQALSQRTKQMLGYDRQRKQYRTHKIKARQTMKGITVNLYHELQTQLKILYTIITRARSVFIIFDSKIPKHLLRLWSQMNLIIQINEQNMEQCREDIHEYVEVNQKHVRYINQNEKWMKAGSEMLGRKDFQNAKKCYLNIQRLDLVQRIKAYQLQIQAERQLYPIISQLQKLSTYHKDDRKIAKIRLEREKKEVYKIYHKAIEIYQHYQRFNDAAEICFKIQSYTSALGYYSRQNTPSNYYKMGLCCRHLKRYGDALEYFKKIEYIEGIISCYFQLKSQSLLLEYLLNNPQYYNKYGSQIGFQKIRTIICQAINKKIQPQLINLLHSMENPFPKGLMCNEDPSNPTQLILLKTLYTNHHLLRQKLINISTTNKRRKSRIIQLKKQNQGYDTQLTSLIQKKKQNKFEERHLLQKQQFLKYSLQKLMSNSSGQGIKKQKQQQKQLCQLLNLMPTIQQKSKNILKQLTNVSQKKKANMFQISKMQSQISKIQQQIPQLQLQQSNSFLSRNMIEIQRKIKQLTKNVSIIDFSMKKPTILNQIDQDKAQLINNSILDIVNKSEKLIEYNFQAKNEEFPHKFIRSMFKDLKNSQVLELLKKCDFIENDLGSLLICQYNNELQCLQLKYIIRGMAQFSKNLHSNRHYHVRSQIQQTKQINNRFLKYITAMKSIPIQHRNTCFIFSGSVLYETINNQIIYALAALGYFKQILQMMPETDVFHLSILLSEEKIMKKQLRRLFKQQQGPFTFIQQQIIKNNHFQALQANIFSLQKIFFLHDEYQEHPFLSLKKQPKNVEIDNHMAQYIDDEVVERIKIADYQLKRIEENIKLLNQTVQRLEKSKQQMKVKILNDILIIVANQRHRIARQQKKFPRKMLRKQKQEIEQQIQKLKSEKNYKYVKLKKQYETRLKQQQLLDEKSKPIRIKPQIQKKLLILNSLESIIKDANMEIHFKIQQIYCQIIALKSYEQQLKESILKNGRDKIKITQVIKQQLKQQQNNNQLKLLVDTNKQLIFSKSNIPNEPHYNFIRNYINQQPSENSSKDYKIEIYERVIKDGIRIHQLQKDINKSIRICNVIMLYLGYLFNIKFQRFINLMFENLKDRFEKKKQRIINLTDDINKIQQKISQIQLQIRKTYRIQWNKMQRLRKDQQNAYKQKSYKQDLLTKLFSQRKLNYEDLEFFLETVSKKIMNLKQPNDITLNILLGIFKCRVIRSQQVFGFLANQYVFVQKQSILLSLLKEGMFAYYFDQQNRNIVCRFEDIVTVICEYIEKHLTLTKITNKINEEIQKNIISNKFDNLIKLRFRTFQQKEQDQKFLKIAMVSSEQKQEIEKIYKEYFLTSELFDRIKNQKRKMLQYYLKNEHKESQAFFFFIYQIQQYYYLQKILRSLTTFDYNIIKQILFKLKELENQYIKWMAK